jgi:type II secretory ATPase GspE/PulE/Tfp pilus assembly ATPase PilB-like protein
MEYAYLRVKTPSGERPVHLSSVPLTIGRHESNRLVIDDTMASRFHCVVERVPDGYIMRDLQSRNGTNLNGQRVMSAQLKSGDVLAIGSVSMTVVIHTMSESLAGKPNGAPAAAAGAAGAAAPAGRTDFRNRNAPKPAAPAAKAAPVPARAGAAKGAPAAEAVDDLEVVDELEVIEDAPTGMAGMTANRNEPPMRALRRTADAMSAHDFDVEAITLINTRGKTNTDAQDNTSEIAMLFRLTLLICFRSRATDIHLEPREDHFLLRIRMDGNLLDIAHFDRDSGTKYVALIKILCELDTTQRFIVQEGHFASRAPNPNIKLAEVSYRRVDYRVSFVPSLHGQKMVIRIFDAANAPALMEDLNLPPAIAEIIAEDLTKDAGLILVCGPTGSGKTTTLYSLLRSCGGSFRNIVTIEDPVEVQIEGTTQLPVDESQGNTFAALLRSVLRQDPDVIMVGEIRDPETAKIALQASMTGHLVLSTIHTRDTIGTIFRMLDLGLESYMVAQGLHLVLAQRLVRTLCMSCRRAHAPSPEDRKRLGRLGAALDKIYAPVGCPRCLGTGYYSRRAFFEFLSMNDRLREQVMKNPSIMELQALLGPDFLRLTDNGYQLVAQGLTSIDEVDRAVGR